MSTQSESCYAVRTASITPPPGLTALDEYRRTPGSSITRIYEIISDSKERSFGKSPEFIFKIGVAMGIDGSGLCWPYHSGKDLQFVGFLCGQSVERVVVKVRGSVVLPLAGLNGVDHGRPVFAVGPDEFTLDEEAGGVEIGAVRFAEDKHRATVAFRMTGDPQPLSMAVRIA